MIMERLYTVNKNVECVPMYFVKRHENYSEVHENRISRTKLPGINAFYISRDFPRIFKTYLVKKF